MTPIVSVIIPSYNHEKFVGECIQSVLNQTFQDFEIIITDDGSSDHTVKVIESFTDPRIKLFKHAVNKGACIAGNNCLRHATGKYIAVLSSDDAWYPEKLEVQVKYLDSNKDIAVVFGKVDWVDENGSIIRDSLFPLINLFEVNNRSRFEWLRYFFLTGNCLCHPSSLVRAECYQEVGLFDPAFASLPDLDFWIRICLRYDIHILDQKLVRFRKIINERNASGNTIETHIRNRHELKQSLNHYLQITCPEDLLSVFPEVRQYGEVVSDGIPYLIARVAINTGWDFKILWGLETIFNLFQDEEKVHLLESLYGFTYIDFIQLSGSCDPYKVATIDRVIPVSHKSPIMMFLSASRRYVRELKLVMLQILEPLKHIRRNNIK
jgi:glycosyltransferase involved in cell wall biosynthesis